MPEAEPPDDECPACCDNGWVWDWTVRPVARADCPEGCRNRSRQGKAT